MLNLIVKNLLRRRARTLLTVAGIAIGVATIVALGAMGQGLRTGYVSMFSGSGADLTIMQKGAFDITLSAVDEQAIEQVAALPGVRAATGMVVGNIAAPGAPYFFVFGYDPNSFAIERFRIVDGQPLGKSRRISGGHREILLGKQAAEAMKLATGDVIRLTGGAFRIVGVYNSGNGFEDAAAILALPDAQQLLQKQRQVGAIQVKLHDPRQIDQVRDRLEELYPRYTITQSGQVADQQEMVAYIQGFAFAIALLAVVIGGIGMANTVMMSTFERTSEIGTLRALGWGRRRVLWMVLCESILLSIVGGLIGCALGAAVVASLGQNAAISFLQGTITIDLVFGGIFTAIILGAVGGLYPARRASKMLPIEALRYQGGAGQDIPPRLRRLRSETLRSVLRRRGRTALTVIGISIGLAAIVLLAGLSDGFITIFGETATANDVDLVVRQADASDLAYSAISERVGRQLAALPGVQSVSGIIIGVVTMDEIPFLLLWGYAPNEPAINHFKVVEGRGLSGNREVILGRLATDALKVRVGDMVRFGEVGFRVVGVFETGLAYEESSGVVSLRDAQTLIGKPRQVSLYGIKLNDPQQADAIQTRIAVSMPEVFASPSTEFAENLPDLQRMNVMVWAISALALVVGGIGMTNTVVMSVYERTREIGTLRALGWQRRRILAMILRESLTLSLMGIVVGAALAAVLGFLLQQIPVWGSYLIVHFSPALLAQALFVAVLLGACGGWYPARRASKLSPVEALRYE